MLGAVPSVLRNILPIYTQLYSSLSGLGVCTYNFAAKKRELSSTTTNYARYVLYPVKSVLLRTELQLVVLSLVHLHCNTIYTGRKYFCVRKVICDMSLVWSRRSRVCKKNR